MQKKVYSWDELYAGVLVGRPNGETVEVDGDEKTVTVHVQEQEEHDDDVQTFYIPPQKRQDTEGPIVAACGLGCPDCDDSDDYNDAEAEKADVYVATKQGEVRLLSRYGGSSIVESFFDPAEARKEARRLNRNLKEVLAR
jgi:hypothetical protein